MSIQSQIEVHPVVLRFAGMFPADLGGYEAHRTRKGGDLGHVDRSRSDDNRRLLGEEGWAQRALDDIRAMAAENHADDLEALERRRRTSEIKRRIAEGPKDPWRPTRHGPLREVILTANKAWFEQIVMVGSSIEFDHLEKLFEERAIAWLKKNFGDDVIHARADLDEEAYHIHAVILPKVRKPVHGRERWALEPSKHPLIKDYEAAQDSVGEWFKDIGLKRGERRKQAFLDALETGTEPPPKRDHVRPADWRKAEERRLARRRARLVALRKGLAERRARLTQREEELEAGKGLLKQRERGVEASERRAGARLAEAAEREQLAQQREDEAETVLAVAMAVSTGEVTVDTPGETPRLRISREDAGPKQSLIARLRRSVPGRSKAVRAIGAAWARLRDRAENRAREAVARDVSEIKAADDAIVAIAAELPDTVRRKIASLRKAIVPLLVARPRSRASSETDARSKPKPSQSGGSTGSGRAG